MAQAAADGPAVAGLAVPDLGERFVQERQTRPTSSERSIARWRVIAPTVMVRFESVMWSEMWARSSIRFRSTTSSGNASRRASIGMSDWPPASSFALSRVATRSSASPRLAGS